MISVRWYKVWNDLGGNKTRTALIVLSIAVGLFAVGMIVSTRAILDTELHRSYAAIQPSSGSLRTLQLFDADFVQAVRALPGVAAVEPRRVLEVRAQVGPDTWVNLTLFAVADYDAMQVNKIRPQAGAWPPPERALLVERAALALLNTQIGENLLIETADGKQRTLPVAGTAHDLAQLPAPLDGTPYAYISLETLKWLGEPYGFNALDIAAVDATNPAAAQAAVNAVKDKAEKNGLTIPLNLALEPGQLPVEDILQAVLLLMGILGLLALFLSAFLIINTVSALLTQQRRQIGVMKALGAQTGQLLSMYLVMVTTYGALALLLAVPLSSVGARGLSRFIAAMFNFDLSEVHVTPVALGLQLAVGLLTPALASLFPFLANLRITAAAAMSSYQVPRHGAGAQLLAGARLWFARNWLRRPLLLAARNTFRSRGRLALTLITLTLGSAIFISVFSVRASLFRTLDDLMRWWNFDTLVGLNYPYRVEKLLQTAQTAPGVVQSDVWLQLPTRRVRPDGSESEGIFMFAPRLDSTIEVMPALVAGRWLLPADENAIVVSAVLLQDEPDLQLGSDLVLKLAGRERSFHIVGISQGVIAPMVYTPYSYVSRLVGEADRANAVLVIFDRRDPASIAAATARLEEHFEHAGLQVNSTQLTTAERAEAGAAFGVIIVLLLIMAVLLALVGGLGLMGTMSINVLERTREIGILRAIGAPHQGVALVFILEGLVIGGLSWLGGALLAFPLGHLLSDAVGQPLMGTPLTFSYAPAGAWLWLLSVLLLSAVASFIPARNAARLTVREVLAYE